MLAAEIVEDLRAALEEFKAVLDDLRVDPKRTVAQAKLQFE